MKRLDVAQDELILTRAGELARIDSHLTNEIVYTIIYVNGFGNWLYNGKTVSVHINGKRNKDGIPSPYDITACAYIKDRLFGSAVRSRPLKYVEQ